jgi:hypothetical protein
MLLRIPIQLRLQIRMPGMKTHLSQAGNSTIGTAKPATANWQKVSAGILRCRLGGYRKLRLVLFIGSYKMETSGTGCLHGHICPLSNDGRSSRG